jgi:tuftelin-interacting protein 11
LDLLINASRFIQGTGLGASAQGIVTPVESKLRPKGNVGIAFGGFKERTKQAVAEDRRRGKVAESDDEDKPRRKGGKKKGKHFYFTLIYKSLLTLIVLFTAHLDDEEKVDRSEMWKKKSKSKKVVVEHKTYEQIVQEAGLDTSAHQAGIGPIIDATGATPREISSLSQISSAGASWTPSSESTRIPEIRHNLRLLVEMTQRDLQGLAREGKLVAEKKRQGKEEEKRTISRVKEEADLIRRLEAVRIVCDELTKEARTLQHSGMDISDEHINENTPSPLQSLTPHVNRLLSDFAPEYDRYRLDELLVGAIAPFLRSEFIHWDPLQEPSKWTQILKEWNQALKMSEREKVSNEVGTFYGFSQEIKPQVEEVKVMTPYEALLWHAWLPKVRSAIK